ncbi:MAG: hypothetical protein A2170_07000 [Deltaproteobacteria bacterium RBG_13_53_10]|nr:MAG: hypothetical protein A2170_07000 [Deltaproteobacteria bacterium RBG_13_53_10]
MVGITSFGAYVPVYRLKRDEISRAWGTKSLGGERAVAGHDEDSLTMAVGAALDCMKQGEKKIDGLFFASTTPPYHEKQVAAMIAATMDLPEKTRTADFVGSLRSGTIALNSAIDAVRSGSAENILVAVSDSRMGIEKSQFEQLFGDGAVALTIGNSGVMASIEGSYSLFSELMDTWRVEGKPFVQSWEERFILGEGYLKTMEKVVTGIMEKERMTPKDFAKLVLYGTDGRSHANLAKRLGFDLKTQVQELPLDSIGNIGVAMLPMMIVNALCQSPPEVRILVANYGDGGDAFILKVTKDVERMQGKHRINEGLGKKTYIDYERYLSWRDLIALEEARRPERHPPSITCWWRDRKSAVALYGSKCKRCGTVHYPLQRICAKCQAKDDSEEYRLSDKRGRIFTYAIDTLTASKKAPAIVGVVDFEGGGRMMCEIADCEPPQIQIGMPVEMCLRKQIEKGGMHHYVWRARPVL